MTIAIGCDHAGYPYKDAIKSSLQSRGDQILDFGTDSPESVDYPDFVHPAVSSVESGEADFAVLICGSGNGVCITANKHQDIRAAICWNEELSRLAREHNDSNAVCIPARCIPEDLAVRIVTTFLESDFAGGRHARRVGKIRIC
mgnify:CR=1 FL=1